MLCNYFKKDQNIIPVGSIVYYDPQEKVVKKYETNSGNQKLIGVCVNSYYVKMNDDFERDFYGNMIVENNNILNSRKYDFEIDGNRKFYNYQGEFDIIENHNVNIRRNQMNISEYIAVGMIGVFLILSSYRTNFSLPESWILLKEEETRIVKEHRNGIIVQYSDQKTIVLDNLLKDESKLDETTSYDLYLLK